VVSAPLDAKHNEAQSLKACYYRQPHWLAQLKQQKGLQGTSNACGMRQHSTRKSL
jgi:hypothetical protein